MSSNVKNSYESLVFRFAQVLPEMPVTTQDISHVDEMGTLPQEQRLALARKEIECIFTFAKVSSLAAQIRFSTLPKGTSKEDAAKEILQWKGWKAVEDKEVSVEWLTEYGNSAWSPILSVESVFKERKGATKKFADAINAIYDEENQVTTSHDFQAWRYEQQKTGHLMHTSSVETGDEQIEKQLETFINETGASTKSGFLEHMKGISKEGETVRDTIARVYGLDPEGKQEVDFFSSIEPSRALLGGTTGGFLFALQQGLKAGGVSQKFMDQHSVFIQWCLEHTELMDKSNFNSRFGKPGKMYDDTFTAQPSSYIYLKAKV